MERDVILAAYKSFNEHDIDALLALVCEDVDWMNGLTGGRMKGKEELRRTWALGMTSISATSEPLRIYEEDGKTVVRTRQIIYEANGGPLIVDQEIEQVYTLRDGLVERMDFRRVDD